ncbi:MAG TPA: SGNH/GDSL hydrolase family protein [Alphaproteobacteria bacterium]|nr:SGNH/GDSL hydrolase family protein [Alphaproteobacteria bacterium]
MFSAAPVHAAVLFDRIVVFGDSLSDTGNAGRFTDGEVWVEHLARGLGLGLTAARMGGLNYAVGGARTHGGSFSLREQVQLFMATRAPGRSDPSTLYIVFGGSNDLRALVGVSDKEAGVDAAVAEVNSLLRALVGAGAREFLVPNLPDISRTPEARGYGADWMREAHALTRRFNAGLDRVLQEIERSGTVRIHRLDVYGLLEAAAADPQRFQLRDLRNPCPAELRMAGCGGYLFWDSMHPTSIGHAQLGEAALVLLKRDID